MIRYIGLANESDKLFGLEFSSVVRFSFGDDAEEIGNISRERRRKVRLWHWWRPDNCRRWGLLLTRLWDCVLLHQTLNPCRFQGRFASYEFPWTVDVSV